METKESVRGLWCAMLTPLAREGCVDHARFASHALWMFAHGVDGVAPFGTTGEGQSFSLGERAAGLSGLLAAGIPGQRVVAATGCVALAETIALTRQAVQSDCVACLVLPPFFFREVADEGLFAWYARLIEAVGDSRLRVLLYHIPQVTGVPLSVDLVARLAEAFPGVIAGVKDSDSIHRKTRMAGDTITTTESQNPIRRSRRPAGFPGFRAAGIVPGAGDVTSIWSSPARAAAGAPARER